jgi:hypothetical protein
MTERFAPYAAVFTMALVLLLSPGAWTQQQTRGASGEQLQNPTAAAVQNERARQNRNQAASGTETIRGLISGVTAEGEVMLDFRTNTAARTEGAFLTIVGSPIKSEAGNKDRQASGAESEQRAWSGGQRHNIYVAWLSPRTKIFKPIEQPGRADQNQRQNESQTQTSERQEVTLDQLEVGDHVEIQFSPQEDSSASNNVHQSQQIRQKHGRHRTFVGNATSIVVLPVRDHDKSSPGRDARSDERSK